jgi:hypothetical protein
MDVCDFPNRSKCRKTVAEGELVYKKAMFPRRCRKSNNGKNMKQVQTGPTDVERRNYFNLRRLY